MLGIPELGVRTSSRVGSMVKRLFASMALLAILLGGAAVAFSAQSTTTVVKPDTRRMLTDNSFPIHQI